MKKEKLEKILFDGSANAYAVLDGASIEKLRTQFYEMRPPHYCLFRGRLAADMEEVAPYLVGLIRGTQFTEWLLSEKPGNHYGIFAKSRQSIIEMRRHFRGLLTVHDDDGKPMIFRFYDPRVLRSFLPTCKPGEIKALFGSVETLIAEDEKGENFAAFSHNKGSLVITEIDGKGV